MKIASGFAPLALAVGLIWLLGSSLCRAGYETPARTFDWPGTATSVAYHLLPATANAPSNETVTVLLLGGGPGFSSWNLQPIQKRLAQAGWRVAVMDMAGVGENVQLLPSVADKPLKKWVAQIRAWHEAQGGGPLVLVGHSWGALMAMLYTRAYPEAVRQWVLLNPVDPERKAMQGLAEAIDQRQRAHGLNTVTDDWADTTTETLSEEALARRQLQQALPTYFEDVAEGRRYAAQFSARDFRPTLNIAAWQAYSAKPISYDWIRRWQAAESRRVDFIECKQDYFMPTNLQRMTDQMQLDSVTVLEGCAHFPWVENAAAFYPALLDALAGR
ncbi:alpha/beta fold hydrolase [Thiomicrospira sp. WB1]|uniref:alpha/beta fold hydrolase n=1 Tax=Thiomicrospira sp. WB1 TaxID=1685380 RepID=UPI0007477125|nr:alpha/beta hydrolase [Thiomicrospira sp. WB1]KUJ71083.1 hypothetical protein AVO41_09440 [Thiomicrospira sp. WB1]